MELKIGNSVKVKDGVKQPDSEDLDISGWQGRIVEINNDSNNENNTIHIEWDSLTLKQLPAKFIEQSEMEWLDWKTMILFQSELDKATPRDTNAEVKKAQDLLTNKYYWASLGDEGLRISSVLEGLDPKDEEGCSQKWHSHLEKELSFPIQALVTKSFSNWLIKDGENVRIKSLSIIDDTHGIIAAIKLEHSRESFEYPLCYLEVLDKTIPNYKLINNYAVWFDNK